MIPSMLFCRINRNIVECKETIIAVFIDFHRVLIETSWNVKMYLYNPLNVVLLSY